MRVPRKYQTFWRRFGAMWIDFLVLSPLLALDFYLMGAISSPVGGAAWMSLNGALHLGYVVALHALFGQTVGKRVTRIRVRCVDGSPLGWRRALMRDSVWIAIFLLGTVARFRLAFSGVDPHPPFAQADEAVHQLSWLDWAIQIWFWLELITMLTNSKRRAIHDYLAGSVVVRLKPREPQGAT